MIKGDSAEKLLGLPAKSFDVIYIDADHNAGAVFLDAAQAWRLLKDDGVLIFDDYNWEPNLPAHSRPHVAIAAFLTDG